MENCSNNANLGLVEEVVGAPTKHGVEGYVELTHEKRQTPAHLSDSVPANMQTLYKHFVQHGISLMQFAQRNVRLVATHALHFR